MDAENKIIKAYFESKEQRLYFNEIKEKIDLSNSSLQNALNKLIRKGLLKSEKTKSNRFYSIENKKIFGLKFSEIAEQKFKELNLNVKYPLKKFLEQAPRNVYTIILFGSAAEKEENAKSDIDILIVSEKHYDYDKIKQQVDALSNHPLSIFQCTIKEFIKPEDPLIIQAVKKGLPIFHEQNFYEANLNEHQNII